MAVDALARALAAGKVPVSAYEMAVKAGYTGTEEQFAEDMGNSGTNATNAADSAAAAAASATTAANAAGNLAPAYSSSATYTVGDHVLYDGGYYVCNTAITTAEAWTAAHWTAAKVGPEITDLKTQLDYIRTEELVVSKNLLNPANIGDGYYWTSGHVDSESYMNTGFIPVESGKTYYLYSSAGGTWESRSMRFLTAYDENKNVLSTKSVTTVTSYTVTDGVAYIIISAAPQFLMFSPMVTTESENVEYEIYFDPYTNIIFNPDMIDTTLSQAGKGADAKSVGDAIDSELDYTMMNRLDPSACVTGKRVDPSSGEIGDNASYFTTDYMEIRPGETLYLFRLDGVLKTANRYAAYDKSKNVLGPLGSSSETDHIAQTGEMAYVRISFNYVDSDIYRTPFGIACIATAKPQYIPGFGGGPVIKSSLLRPVVNIYTTDTEAQIIKKMVDAYNTGNCDIYFERGQYTFGDGLATVAEDYHLISNEIPIGNGCRYFFNGATLTATIDLSEHPAVGDEEFYCNFLGCQRIPSSYELHDGVLIATDTRYVVHDESSALNGSYKHLYQNMEMHYHTNLRQEAIRKCIGGGTGASGVVEIVGCKFTTDASDSCVSFHGNASDVSGAEFDLNIRNCWFSNAIRCGTLSANQTARLFYSGNSAIAAPDVRSWTETSFLNEIRT